MFLLQQQQGQSAETPVHQTQETAHIYKGSQGEKLIKFLLATGKEVG